MPPAVTWPEQAQPGRHLGRLRLGVRDARGVVVGAAPGPAEPIPVDQPPRAGLLTQKLTYENGLLKMNYTGGDTCHKVYQRSTAIFFYCHRSTQKVRAAGLGSPGAPWPLPPPRWAEGACGHLLSERVSGTVIARPRPP